MEWISVKKNLPEFEEKVLCITKTKKGNFNHVIGYYADGRWCCGMNSNVTHWMPLPSPPEPPKVIGDFEITESRHREWRLKKRCCKISK